MTLFVLHRVSQTPLDVGVVVLWVSTWIVASLVGTGYHRRQVLRRHGFDPKTLKWAPPNVRAATAPSRVRLVPVAPIAFAIAAALAVVAPFAVLASLGRIGAGSGNFTSGADAQLPATIAAVAVATLIAATGIVGRRSISRRFTRTITDGAQIDLVFSDLGSAGTLSAAVTAGALFACFTPVTPLIVPLAFVVSAGVVPVAILAGIAATRHHPDGSIVVWTTRPAHADAPFTT